MPAQRRLVFELAAAARSLPLALGALFAVFLTFEFTVVTAAGLITEILPDTRGLFAWGLRGWHPRPV